MALPRELCIQNRSWHDVFVRFYLLPDSRRMLGLVALTGILGGVVGAIYILVLKAATNVLGPNAWELWPHLALMAGVGIVIAVLVKWLGAPADVELLVDNIHVLGGPDEAKGLRALIPASLLAIAAGGPLGPEAPLVTTTGVLGSVLARRAGLNRSQLRIITITGMAAGFTVLFGAPLGSAVFALEILHRRGMEYYEALMPAVIGALGGYAVAAGAGVIGLHPIWKFPAITHLVPADLAFGVVAGIVGAIVSVVFTYLTLGLRRAIGIIPPEARPALGGVAFGLLAMASPYALTNGELQMNDMAATKLTLGVLLGAAAVKLLTSAIAVVTGWRGGFIIPLFFVGFALGRATEGYLPGGAHSWALIAGLMAACNVGVTKTPLGSTLVVSEMAGFVVLPTTLLASMVSLVLTSDVGLIDSQRRRLALGEDGGDIGEVNEELTGEVLDLDEMVVTSPRRRGGKATPTPWRTK